MCAHKNVQKLHVQFNMFLKYYHKILIEKENRRIPEVIVRSPPSHQSPFSRSNRVPKFYRQWLVLPPLGLFTEGITQRTGWCLVVFSTLQLQETAPLLCIVLRRHGVILRVNYIIYLLIPLDLMSTE